MTSTGRASAPRNPRSVTALLTAYRAESFIQAALDSLSAQTRRDFDVLVSVDGADEDTYAVCRRHAERDDRFFVIKQENRLGWLGNQNFLLEHAQSDYVLHAFADDELTPDYLSELCAVLDDRPEVVLSYSDIALTYTDGTNRLMRYDELDGVRSTAERGWRVFSRRDPAWWVPQHGVFRLERARAIGGWKKSAAGEFSADWPWLFHLSLLGEFARTPKTLYRKFYTSVSVSRNWTYDDWKWGAVRRTLLQELLQARIPLSDKLHFLRLLASQVGRTPRAAVPALFDLMRRRPSGD